MAGLLVLITDVNALGLKAAQGLLLTTSFYWDMDDKTREWSKRFFAKINRMPTMWQAGVYSSVMHYLKAVQATGTDDPLKVAAKMREMPVEDFFCPQRPAARGRTDGARPRAGPGQDAGGFEVSVGLLSDPHAYSRRTGLRPAQPGLSAGRKADRGQPPDCAWPPRRSLSRSRWRCVIRSTVALQEGKTRPAQNAAPAPDRQSSAPAVSTIAARPSSFMMARSCRLWRPTAGPTGHVLRLLRYREAVEGRLRAGLGLDPSRVFGEFNEAAGIFDFHRFTGHAHGKAGLSRPVRRAALTTESRPVRAPQRPRRIGHRGMPIPTPASRESTDRNAPRQIARALARSVADIAEDEEIAEGGAGETCDIGRLPGP